MGAAAESAKEKDADREEGQHESRWSEAFTGKRVETGSASVQLPSFTD